MISQRLRSQPTMEHVDGVTTITFSLGKIAGEENFIARELTGLTDGLGQGDLFVDLKNVISLVSAELGTLVSLSKRRNAAGGRLTLVNVNPRIGQVLERTNLNKCLDIRKEGPPPLRYLNGVNIGHRLVLQDTRYLQWPAFELLDEKQLRLRARYWYKHTSRPFPN